MLDKTPHGIRRAFSLTVLLRLPARLSVTSLRFRHSPVSGFPLVGLNSRIPYAAPSHRQEPLGPPKFLCASLPACHGLWTPADLSTLALLGVLVLPSADVKPSASATTAFRSCTGTSGRAVTPTAYRILCLRFAQILFVVSPSLLSPLSTGRKTRYGWLAKPYPAGTFTLQETPSFLGAKRLTAYRCQVQGAESQATLTGLARLPDQPCPRQGCQVGSIMRSRLRASPMPMA
jgi:hypothetical protein